MTANQELKIRWEWEGAAQVRAPEHRATWARGRDPGRPRLCHAGQDRESGSLRAAPFTVRYTRWQSGSPITGGSCRRIQDRQAFFRRTLAS